MRTYLSAIMTTVLAQAAGGAAAAAASNVLMRDRGGLATPPGLTPPGLTGLEKDPHNKGNMGYGEGLKLLEQMVKQNQLVRDQMKMDLREFMKSNLHGNFAPGSLNFPRGGGLPVQGYRLPGALSAVVKNRLGYPINSQKEEKTILNTSSDSSTASK